MKYEKIQTLWKRDTTKKPHVIMPGEYSKEEFKQIQWWVITEKIDGMNIRVIYNKDGVRFAGRTDRAHLPDPLVKMLIETFTLENLSKNFDLEKSEEIILYGEGYGPKIQKGGKYREDQSFILFDICIDGIWLLVNDVDIRAHHLGVDSVPIWGCGTVDSISALIETRPKSLVEGSDCVIEGFVCRSNPVMLDRFGNRVIWKLKIKDFEQLERLKESTTEVHPKPSQTPQGQQQG